MPDLCCHNLNIYVILNWFVLTASILCNLYCPFLLFVKKQKEKKSSHFMFFACQLQVRETRK